MIKLILKIAISLLPFTTSTTAAEAADSASFTSALRTAITEKDDQKLERLICFDGASQEDKQRMISMLRRTLMNGKDVDEISFIPLPSDFDPILILHGQKIEPTATPKGKVKVTFKGGGQGTSASSSAYTVVNGKVFFVGMKSTDLGWKGPPDKNISFSVVGQGSSELQIQGVWNASGVKLQRTFKESNLTFWGQHFEELNVKSDSDDCDVTVTITEDGKEIYSAPLKGKGVLQYKKKS